MRAAGAIVKGTIRMNRGYFLFVFSHNSCNWRTAGSLLPCLPLSKSAHNRVSLVEILRLLMATCEPPMQ
jgi:hypothetical protein